MTARKQEEVGWLEVAVAEAHALHVCQGAHERHEHLLHFFLAPEEVILLSLSEDVLEVLLVFYVLADDADAERVVHCLVEKVTVELDDILMVLRLEQLHGLLLVLVELVKGFGLDLFEGVEFAGVPVDYFVDLSILLARAQQIDLFEIFFSKHFFNLKLKFINLLI